MKFARVLITFTILFVVLASQLNAATFTDIKVDDSVSMKVDSTGRKSKVIFAPVRKRQVINTDLNKYLAEVNYFFFKFNFKSSPVSHALLENGSVITINPNWQKSNFESSDGKNTTIVLMIYENSFDISKFTNALTGFKANVINNADAQLELKSVEDLSIKTFKIKMNGNDPSIEYGDADVQTESLRKSFQDLKFSYSSNPILIIKSLTSTKDAYPDKPYSASILIENTSKYDVIFGSKTQLSLRFANNSDLFVSDDWASPKLIFSKSEGFIEAGKTVEYQFKYQAALLPGENKEQMSLYFGEKEVDKKDFVSTVADVGQKVLKIKPAPLGFVTVRSGSNISTEDIGRAASGLKYLFTTEENGFHKIKINGKEGWVSSKYVEVIKK